MYEEQTKSQGPLLRSAEDMKAGRSARKTVFEIDGDEVRRVPQAPTGPLRRHDEYKDLPER
jgi:hypothetical protein